MWAFTCGNIGKWHGTGFLSLHIKCFVKRRHARTLPAEEILQKFLPALLLCFICHSAALSVRKSYEFEDLLQSSTEGCRVDWYAQSRLGLTRTLSEENVYEDIIGKPFFCICNQVESFTYSCFCQKNPPFNTIRLVVLVSILSVHRTTFQLHLSYWRESQSSDAEVMRRPSSVFTCCTFHLKSRCLTY